MSDPGPRATPGPPAVAARDELPAPGVVGIGLAAVLTFALAQGSWQWFATFIGGTLLAVLLAFQRRAQWTPDIRSGYMRGLIAYALVVGLCVAVALAPLLQRWAWLFPMPGTRHTCELMGRYEALQVKAALGDLAGADGAALDFAQDAQAGRAVAECLAATTTLWLPVYGVGAALLVGVAAWFRDRARSRRAPSAATASGGSAAG
ncbi:hypothetical protein [Streptomyces sp. NBC_00503]|uniref:hypothetical protein n=1 Tax=Streptomyces sp. NBC_00503 TaxID=2903659 RepID=UPI002E81866D|nr:hypothetical protein [Streptomyces sp. NBC_00503]WUD79590.1 hypothetical protein OG490_02800 [Streptomyces sp. NBC_00503]